MAGFFTIGETKVRPGVYSRYENNSGVLAASTVNGIAACTIKSNWGPLEQVVILESTEQARSVYGENNNTTSLIDELFLGGAQVVKAVRLGTGGTPGTFVLKDTSSEAQDAINVSCKCAGNRVFQYLLRTTLTDENVKEFCLYENNRLLERFTFAVSEQEVDGLIAATANSTYLTFTKAESYSGTNKLATVTQTAITTGTDPVITNADYSAAFVLLEAHRYNTICIDSDDAQLHSLLTAYVDRVYGEGKMGFAVIGEPLSVEFDTRASHAKAFNDYKTIYMGGAWKDAVGNVYEGWKAAARIAGMVAAIPSNQSITHKAITGATEVVERLTNSQYETAINSGMLTLSTSAAGTVWVESGITTLVTPGGEDDEGWKKIKRTKNRMELMTRANDTIEPLIGNVNNNSDGQATVLQALQGLLNDMVAEDKLAAPSTVELDANNAPAGDSAWFVFDITDVDTLEKVYLVFKFKFSATV